MSDNQVVYGKPVPSIETRQKMIDKSRVYIIGHASSECETLFYKILQWELPFTGLDYETYTVCGLAGWSTALFVYSPADTVRKHVPQMMRGLRTCGFTREERLKFLDRIIRELDIR